MKRILLVICCIISFLGVNAQPSETFKLKNIVYRIYGDGTARVAGSDKKTGGIVKIDENVTYKGLPFKVVAIDDSAFANCENLSKVNLPNTITSIGYRAFYGCRNMYEMVIPTSVKEIGAEAFNFCTGLVKMHIPAAVEEIGDGAFWHNWALKNITVDNNNKDYVDINGVLFTKNCTRLLAYPSGKTDQVYTIPTNTTTIATGAFAYSKDLTSVVLPPDLVEIRRFAFQECSRLKSITIPNNIDIIEMGAFSGCGDMVQVVFPEKVKRIGDKAFENCHSLTALTIPDEVESIGDRAFAGCKELKTIDLPRTLKNIGVESFADCVNINSIHLFGVHPPKVDADAFPTNLFETATLYVKYFAVDAYNHSDDWVNFKFIYRERAYHRPYGMNY
ncbi:MAG: leucine-rich repeat domain-containing protein [Paludibacteraceae bacterium]|nr:leucine-rich repeat domain-containing protein [Paludibacteraceae bacterium]